MSTYVRIMSIHLTVAGLFSSSTRRRRPLCQGSGDKVAKTFETSATSRVHLVVEDTGELKKKEKKKRKTRVQREIKRGICWGTDAAASIRGWTMRTSALWCDCSLFRSDYARNRVICGNKLTA